MWAIYRSKMYINFVYIMSYNIQMTAWNINKLHQIMWYYRPRDNNLKSDNDKIYIIWFNQNR